MFIWIQLIASLLWVDGTYSKVRPMSGGRVDRLEPRRPRTAPSSFFRNKVTPLIGASIEREKLYGKTVQSEILDGGSMFHSALFHRAVISATSSINTCIIYNNLLGVSVRLAFPINIPKMTYSWKIIGYQCMTDSIYFENHPIETGLVLLPDQEGCYQLIDTLNTAQMLNHLAMICSEISYTAKPFFESLLQRIKPTVLEQPSGKEENCTPTAEHGSFSIWGMSLFMRKKAVFPGISVLPGGTALKNELRAAEIAKDKRIRKQQRELAEKVALKENAALRATQTCVDHVIRGGGGGGGGFPESKILFSSKVSLTPPMGRSMKFMVDFQIMRNAIDLIIGRAKIWSDVPEPFKMDFTYDYEISEIWGVASRVVRMRNRLDDYCSLCTGGHCMFFHRQKPSDGGLGPQIIGGSSFWEFSSWTLKKLICQKGYSPSSKSRKHLQSALMKFNRRFAFFEGYFGTADGAHHSSSVVISQPSGCLALLPELASNISPNQFCEPIV